MKIFKKREIKYRKIKRKESTNDQANED